MNDGPESYDPAADYEPPITELLQLPDETDDDFLDRVRRIVRRHMFGSHVVDICIIGSGLVLLQLLFMIGQLASRDEVERGDQ